MICGRWHRCSLYANYYYSKVLFILGQEKLGANITATAGCNMRNEVLEQVPVVANILMTFLILIDLNLHLLQAGLDNTGLE